MQNNSNNNNSNNNNKKKNNNKKQPETIDISSDDSTNTSKQSRLQTSVTPKKLNKKCKRTSFKSCPSSDPHPVVSRESPVNQIIRRGSNLGRATGITIRHPSLPNAKAQIIIGSNGTIKLRIRKPGHNKNNRQTKNRLEPGCRYKYELGTDHF